jgi:8-oxo-dGTP pyrophosphatase MutT (NUDIX family)
MTDLVKQSVSVLILREDLKVLGVSRKDDPENFGLPGGKVDPGESAIDAAYRELKEETGIRSRGDIVPGVDRSKYMIPIFSAYCPGGEDGVAYFNHTFMTEPILSGLSQQEGEGRVAWIPIGLLMYGSFADYNKMLMQRVGLVWWKPSSPSNEFDHIDHLLEEVEEV